jgi:hypothetical protein
LALSGAPAFSAAARNSVASPARPAPTPVAIAAALSWHLDNLNFLSALPPPPFASRIQTGPAKPLTAKTPDQLQNAYLRELGRQPATAAEAAAFAILQRAKALPSVIPLLGEALEDHGGDEGVQAAQSLNTWAQTLPKNTGQADPFLSKADVRMLQKAQNAREAELAWSTLASFFDRTRPQHPSLVVPDVAKPAASPRLRPEISGRLLAVPKKVLPSLKRLDSWLEKPAQDESWIFQDLVPELTATIEGELVEVSQKFRSALLAGKKTISGSVQELQKFYRAKQALVGELWEHHDSLVDLLACYRHLGVGGERLRAILDHSQEFSDGYFTAHNPRTWSELDPSQRKKVRRHLLIDPVSRGVRLHLQVSRGDELRAIAEKYAAGRDPAELEALLRTRLAASPKDTVSIPLQDLLPPFIRDTLGRHEDCHGPNCFNAALSAAGDKEGTRMLVGIAALAAELEWSYRLLPEGAAAQVGDLLIYRDAEGDAQHAAYYVGDGFVFTKNGLSRNNPYLFQSRAANDEIYLQPGTTVSLYRHR